MWTASVSSSVRTCRKWSILSSSLTRSLTRHPAVHLGTAIDSNPLWCAAAHASSRCASTLIGGRLLETWIVANQIVPFFGVLRCISKLIHGWTTGLLGYTLSSCCVSLICDHLCAHVGPSLFSLLLHVLQVLGAGTASAHTYSCSLGWRTLAWNWSFPLLLHLLLAKLLSVTLFLKNPIVLSVICVATAFHQPSEDAAKVVVIGALLEIQISGVLEILAELFW